MDKSIKRISCVICACLIALFSLSFIFNNKVKVAKADEIVTAIYYNGRPFSYQNLGVKYNSVGGLDWNSRVYGQCNFTYLPKFNFYSQSNTFDLCLFDLTLYDNSALINYHYQNHNNTEYHFAYIVLFQGYLNDKNIYNNLSHYERL